MRQFVYAQCIEGGHAVLYGADLYAVLGEHCPAGGIYHVVSHGFDERLSFHVGTLDFIAVVFRRGVEGDGQVQACVQAPFR